MMRMMQMSQSQIENNDDKKKDDNGITIKVGCGGSIVGASLLISVLSFAGIALLFLKRKKQHN